MKLLRDIVDTWRIGKRSTSNWRAVHASGALLVGAILVAVGLWVAVSGQFFRGACILGLGVLFLVHWRYVLPKAMWYSKVEQTPRGK